MLTDRFLPHLERWKESEIYQKVAPRFATKEQSVWITLELTPRGLHGWVGDRRFFEAMHRGSDGRPAEEWVRACRDAIDSAAGSAPSNDLRVRVILPSQGAILRSMELPSGFDGDARDALELQIDETFPIDAESLVWGYCAAAAQEESTTQSYWVAGIRREATQDLQDLLRDLGLPTHFVIDVIEHGLRTTETDAVFLRAGERGLETITVHSGKPQSPRTIPGGYEALLQRLETELPLSKEDVESKLCSAPEEWNPAELARLQSVVSEWKSAVQKLAPGKPIYIIPVQGRPWNPLATWVGEALGSQVVEASETAEDTLAMRDVQLVAKRDPRARKALWKWGAIAAALLIGSLCIRYAEASVKRPRLEKKLAEIRAETSGLSAIDKELNFLRSLESARAPYIETMAFLAHLAPRGAAIESLSMQRGGPLSISARIQKPQEAAEFRSKLAESGFFEDVVGSRFTPGPRRKTITAQIDATWATAASRSPLPESALEGIETNQNQQPGGRPRRR